MKKCIWNVKKQSRTSTLYKVSLLFKSQMNKNLFNDDYLGQISPF